MRIVYFGTPELAVPALTAVAARHQLVAVVAQPDRPKGRSGKPEPPATAAWAKQQGLPVHQPEKLHDGHFESWLKAQAPDLCVVAAYGRLLRQPVLDIPPLGWLNLHPSLLPRWRGPSPIQTALLEGDAVTGVTIMRMVLEMDAGDIVLQEETPIDPDETAGILTERLSMLGAEAMLNGIALVEQGSAPSIPQNPDKVTYSKMFEKEHGRIRWADSALRIHNLVRACNPWPMAHGLFRGQVCRVLRTTAAPMAAQADPGAVIEVGKDRILVATGAGALALLTVQLAGKKAMDMDAFLRGARIEVGERFEDCR